MIIGPSTSPFSEYCEYGCTIHIDKIGELYPASTLSICIAEAPLSKLCYTGHMAQLRATYAMSNDLFLVWTDNNDNNRLGVCIVRITNNTLCRIFLKFLKTQYHHLDQNICFLRQSIWPWGTDEACEWVFWELNLTAIKIEAVVAVVTMCECGSWLFVIVEGHKKLFVCY